MPNSLTAQGLTTATQAELLAYFTTQMQNIYGADINLSADTSDGQLINIIMQAILDVEDLITQVYNSFDPDLAIGTSLDERVAINGIQRQGGTYSITNISITTTATSITFPGLDQTALPAYTVADNAGNQWQLQFSQTSGAPGTYIYVFQSATIGSVLTTPNTINVPVTIIPGVSTVNNPTAQTIVGLDQETDAALRVRRQQSVSIASQGYLAALIGALENINGITSVFVYENRGATTDPQTGVPGHSIWAIVAGNPAPALAPAWSSTTVYRYGQLASVSGVNYISWQNNNLNNTPPNPTYWGVYNAVAQAIYSKRNAGCGMFGSQSYVVTQIDQTQLTINWDTVAAQNLFIAFTATPIQANTAPNIQAILDPDTGIPAIYTPGVFGEVNINQLATLVQQIDPNTLVTFGAVPGLPAPIILFSGGFSAALSQTIIWETVPASGQFKLKYNGNTTGFLQWNDNNATIQAAVAALPGLSSAVVTGTPLTQFLTIDLGVPSALGLITVSDNTVQDSSPSLVQISYNEVFQNILIPEARNYQFQISSGNIIITPMIFIPSSAVVPRTTQKQFNALGGYGTPTYSVITSGSGAPTISSTGLYTAGANAGVDVIQAVDLLGNKVTAQITVT